MKLHQRMFNDSKLIFLHDAYILEGIDVIDHLQKISSIDDPNNINNNKINNIMMLKKINRKMKIY